MKLRLLFALPALLLASFYCHAQAYEAGLLVRSTGDTLRGELENDFWVEPPAFIRFRPTPDSPSQLFQPRQLRAVSFTNGRYFRYEALPVDHAAEVQLDRLPRGYFTDVRTDSLLAEVLLEGPAELLRVVPDGITHYLIRRAGRPYLELSERKYLRETAMGNWAVTEGNNYAAQLGLYFGDCPAASTAATTTPFTTAGIAAVVVAYNASCVSSPQPGRNWLMQAIPRRKLAFQGGLLAGARYNRIGMAGYADGSCADCQVHPYAGLYAELFQPSRTFAVYGELSLSPFQGRGRTLVSKSNTFIYDNFEYRGLLGTARLGVRYFAPLPHEQQLVLGFGFEMNNVLNIRQTSGMFGAVMPRIDFYAFPTLMPNFVVGWRMQRFTLTLDGQTYHDDQGTDASGYFFGANYTTRLGLSYRLGRNPDAVRKANTRQ